MHICSKWNCNMLKFTLACSYFCWSIIFHIPSDTVLVPLFNIYGIPVKKIPCLMCGPVTAMGVRVTWVLGHPHGPANTPWVHFTAVLSWPMPLVGYDSWKAGALGLKNKTTNKNLRELHGFCPITLLPAWYKRILIIQQWHIFTISRNSCTNWYFHPISPLHTGFWIWFCSAQAFGTVFVRWQFLYVISFFALMPTTGEQHIK